MRPSRAACIALLLATSAANAQVALAPAGPSIFGTYVFEGVRHSTMDVHLEGGRHVVTLSGGADPSAGPASAADCYIRAIGIPKARKLTAKFARIETDTFYYSESRAQAEHRLLKVRFANDAAKVTRADVVGYCGLGADFLGAYRRQR